MIDHQDMKENHLRLTCTHQPHSFYLIPTCLTYKFTTMDLIKYLLIVCGLMMWQGCNTNEGASTQNDEEMSATNPNNILTTLDQGGQDQGGQDQGGQDQGGQDQGGQDQGVQDQMMEMIIDQFFDPNLDQDQDGFTWAQDCDDLDPLVNPSIPLSCVWQDLPVCDMPLAEAFTVEMMNPPAKGSNEYVVPSIEQRQFFINSIEATLQGDATSALNAANMAGYQLCATDSIVLWHASGSGQAVLALRTHPRVKNVILETPHSFFDLGTLEEGAIVFDQVEARALLSTGTHRCASDMDSGCAGSTQVCTLMTSDFRISDMAHTEESFFHSAHETLTNHFIDTPVISIHAFLEPGISISNGTKKDTTPDSLVARMTEAMRIALPTEYVTSCNDYGVDHHDARICGTTNTQGRHMNGSEDACGTRPDSASEKFLHIEQNILLIDQPEALIEAIHQVF